MGGNATTHLEVEGNVGEGLDGEVDLPVHALAALGFGDHLYTWPPLYIRRGRKEKGKGRRNGPTLCACAASWAQMTWPTELKASFTFSTGLMVTLVSSNLSFYRTESRVRPNKECARAQSGMHGWGAECEKGQRTMRERSGWIVWVA
jgi:hypothetical protein